MPTERVPQLGIGRAAVAATLAVVLSIIWTQGLAALLRHLGGAAPGVAAMESSVAAVLVALACVSFWRRSSGALAGFGAGMLAFGALTAREPSAWAVALALPVVGVAVAPPLRRLALALPPAWDEVAVRRRPAAWLWLGLALFAVLQVGRLSTYMSDPTSDWFLTTRHPFWAKHECLPAYLFGAELAGRGAANVYDAVHYPGLNPQAKPETAFSGMAVEDPFQYAPQFLLLPHLAGLATHDYATLRVLWYTVQTTLFLGVVIALAFFVGGRAGRLGLLLWPLALIAVPALHALQYGQFHLAAIALGVAAMLAIERRRDALGGGLLAAAVLSKLFPAILIVPLLARRRFRALGWAAGFGLAATALALATFGLAPFMAFFAYHLPRLGDGAAFAFGEAWPEVRELVIAANQGFYGLVLKLGELGVPGAGVAAAVWFNRLAGLFVLLVALWASAGRAAEDRERKAITWLGLLGLASMLSTGAFGDYVCAAATWLVTLRAAHLADRPAQALWVIPAWALQFTLVGVAPIGDWAPPAVTMPLSALGVVSMVALYVWSLAAARVERGAEQDAHAVPATVSLGEAGVR